MKIHSVMVGSHSNGPGLRTVVWFQGCKNMGPGGMGNCPSCWNPTSHSFDGGVQWNPKDLALRIMNERALGTNGLTISGGEPIQAAHDLLALILAVKGYRPDFSIGIYTGYTHRELADGAYEIHGVETTTVYRHELWLRIREHLDFAFMGRYDRTKPVDPVMDTLLDQRPDLRLVTSSNQHLELFSMRYCYSDFESLQCEFSIDGNGLTQICGFPL